MNVDINIKLEPNKQCITDTLMSLLLSADPDRSVVIDYLNDSTMLVATARDVTIGVAVLVVDQPPEDRNKFELKNIAVHEDYQGRGIAKNLIAAVKDQVKSLGGEGLYVGTGNSSLSQIALYQKCGFRMESIEKDFFANYPESIYENGLRCLDKLVLYAKV